MNPLNQIYSLTKQELRIASRTRYIVLTFMLMPLAMWGLQGGVQILIGASLTDSQQGATIFAVNFDEGNGTHSLGNEFIGALIDETQRNGSILFGATIDNTSYTSSTHTHSELGILLNDSTKAKAMTPMIIIPSGFTAAYTNFPGPVPTIEMYSFPGGILGSSLLNAAVISVASSEPFTIVNVEKVVQVKQTTIVFEGEESAASGFGAGFIGMFSVIIAVMAPAPFVATSFAGEREKKTLESLLALPIGRFNILVGKLIAGMVLVGIFSLMNIVGLGMFAFLLSSQVTAGQIGDSYSSVFSIDFGLNLIMLVALTMFLSAFVSMGIGISVASLTKDVRSSESLYNLTMLLPSLLVGMTGLFGALPEESFGGAGILLYIIPWSHAMAILSKGLYPQTYGSRALTGSIATDLLFHLGYLVIVILICLFIASKVFDREGILS
ncbi:MAG: ABC transporter permease subunit [Candidatus Thorarchaeota archaeon]